MIGIWHHAPKDYVQRARLWRSADGTFEVRESIRNYHLANDSIFLRHTIGFRVVDSAATRPMEVLSDEYLENLYYWQAMQAGTARVFSLTHGPYHHPVVSFVLDLSGEEPAFTPIWGDMKQQITPYADFYTALQQGLRAVERLAGQPVLRDPLFGGRMVAGKTLTPEDKAWQTLVDLKAACCRLQHDLDLPDDIILVEVMERAISHSYPHTILRLLQEESVAVFEPIKSLRMARETSEPLIAALKRLREATAPTIGRARPDPLAFFRGVQG